MIASVARELCGVIEIAINRAIALDASIEQKLQPLSDKLISVELTDWQLELHFLITPQSTISVFHEIERTFDVKLSGTSVDFFQFGTDTMLNKQSSMGKVRFEGDITTGQQFQKLFQQLDIDWEQALSEVLGDVLAHRAANLIKDTGSFVASFLKQTMQNSSEYMQEEIRITPSKIEFENFVEQVTDLRTDVDRLLAKAERLMQQLEQQLDNKTDKD